MNSSHPHSSEKEREVDLFSKESLDFAGKLQDVMEPDLWRMLYDNREIPKIVSLHLQGLAQSHQSAEAALLEKLQPLLVDEAPGSNPWYITRIAQNALRAEIRTALNLPKEEDK